MKGVTLGLTMIYKWSFTVIYLRCFSSFVAQQTSLRCQVLTSLFFQTTEFGFSQLLDSSGFFWIFKYLTIFQLSDLFRLSGVVLLLKIGHVLPVLGLIGLLLGLGCPVSWGAISWVISLCFVGLVSVGRLFFALSLGGTFSCLGPFKCPEMLCLLVSTLLSLPLAVLVASFFPLILMPATPGFCPLALSFLCKGKPCFTLENALCLPS